MEEDRGLWPRARKHAEDRAGFFTHFVGEGYADHAANREYERLRNMGP